MKNNNAKAIIIDFILLFLLGFVLMIGIYVLYSLFPNLQRIIAILLLLLMIPICWGTIICSILGKQTIGNRIVNKQKK
ncbi:MAG: hypothetical protein PUB18_04905 [bacterium]|nr:hypothetical protein [bacterium]